MKHCPQRPPGSGSHDPGAVQGRAARRGEAPSGFTLIELMVVLALIAILSAMILPEMKGTYGDALLRSCGRELVNVSRLAYSQAVSHNQIHVVRLEPKTGRYRLERPAPGQRNQNEFAPIKDVAGSSGTIDSRITVEILRQSQPGPTSSDSAMGRQTVGTPRLNEGNSIKFYPDGTADGVDVVLRDQAGFGLRLRVDPVTARVEILELSEKPNTSE